MFTPFQHFNTQYSWSARAGYRFGFPGSPKFGLLEVKPSIIEMTPMV